MRDEPTAALRAARVQVAVGREHVDVARVGQDAVQACRPVRSRHDLGVGPVDELHGCAAAQRHRRSGHAVRDELPPTVSCATFAELVHAWECRNTTSSSGGGRRRNPAIASSSSVASGAKLARRGRPRRGPACHSSPCAPWNGLTQTTWPFATKKPRRPPLAVRRDHADRERAQALEPGDLDGDLLERGDPVAEPSGVLEALFLRQPSQLRLQLRYGVFERLPVDALQRPRGQLRPSPALDRAERAWSRRADDLSPRRRR